MSQAAPDATELVDKSGFLELRGFKHKLFVAVAGDKVFLYKNSEVGAGVQQGPWCPLQGDPRPSLWQPGQSSGEPWHPGAATPKMGRGDPTGGRPQAADPIHVSPRFGDPRSIAPAWVGGISIPNLVCLGAGGVRGDPGHCHQHGQRVTRGAALPHLSAPPFAPQDYRQGIGITYIEMNVGNVKEVDRRGFDLTTPYRIFR